MFLGVNGIARISWGSVLFSRLNSDRAIFVGDRLKDFTFWFFIAIANFLYDRNFVSAFK
jgi:hypothetical protein